MKMIQFDTEWVHMAPNGLIFIFRALFPWAAKMPKLLNSSQALFGELWSTARVFLAEVFHPWVRWEGPGSGFENSSGAAGGVWKSRVHRFGPLGIEFEKQGFRTVRLITGRKFP